MIITAAAIAADLAPRVSVTCDDAAYLLPSADYMDHDFLPWFRFHLTAAKLGYRKGIFDCDDFAREFSRCLIVAARDRNEDAGICVAVLKVRNITRSLGIRQGNHALKGLNGLFFWQLDHLIIVQRNVPTPLSDANNPAQPLT